MRSILCAALAGTMLAAPALYAQQQAGDPVAEYDALLKEIAGLQVYNSVLEQQIASQMAEVDQMRAAMEGVDALNEQLPPLLDRMMAALAQFVEDDVPFEPDVRRESLENLQQVVARADVDISEKFRRVFEAWEIENEYANTYGAYQGTLEIDGVPREVDFLRIGRLILLYQTPDLEYTGAWDHRTREWIPLSSAQRSSVREALRMARSQVAPDLILLPVPPPTNE